MSTRCRRLLLSRGTSRPACCGRGPVQDWAAGLTPLSRLGTSTLTLMRKVEGSQLSGRHQRSLEPGRRQMWVQLQQRHLGDTVLTVPSARSAFAYLRHWQAPQLVPKA